MAKISRMILCAASAALLTGFPAAAQQPKGTVPAEPAAGGAPQAAATPLANAPVEEVIKLYNAKFSEDFIKRKIKSDGTVFNLAVGDLLRLKEAGVPESLVEAMLATRGAASGDAPAGAVSPAAPAVPFVAASAATSAGKGRPAREWDGLVRNSSGAVLGIGHRWENGSLHLENDQFKWIASDGADRNALVPAASLTEQFLVCEKKAGGDCFEWGAKTKNAEYRFRDILWKTGATPKARAIHEYLKTAYPNLPAVTYPVDERK